jgi:hypothetical protein
MVFKASRETPATAPGCHADEPATALLAVTTVMMNYDPILDRWRRGGVTQHQNRGARPDAPLATV